MHCRGLIAISQEDDTSRRQGFDAEARGTELFIGAATAAV
jgi:hypothetical protein